MLDVRVFETKNKPRGRPYWTTVDAMGFADHQNIIPGNSLLEAYTKDFLKVPNNEQATLVLVR